MSQRQHGNVLFLILIAVALFAALSYAVTKSTSGGGNSNREKNALLASEILQMTTSMRVALQRIHISNGIAISDIVFCDGDASGCDTLGDTVDLCSTGTSCLFSPEGGGLTSLNIPTGYGFYLYDERDSLRISGVGTAASDIAIVFMADFSSSLMSLEVCEAINSGLGITTDEETTTDWIIGDGLSIEGQLDFCVDSLSNGNTNYRYYSVLAGL